MINFRDTTDNRPEEKFTTVWPFLFTVFLYFFNIETAEVVFSAYIYDYGRCSKYQNFGDGNGAVLPAIFWVRLRQTPFSGRVVLLGLYYDPNTVQIPFEMSELKTAWALKAKIRE